LANYPFQYSQLVSRARFLKITQVDHKTILNCFEMAEKKLPFAEGASINRAPMFSGVNYQFWKIRMKIFIESIDQGIWDAILNGPYTPKHVVDNKHVDKP